MSRRRPTLRAFLRRRWRTVGFLVVLFLGALLVLAITDRGHDPLWQGRAPVVAHLAVSPQGDAVYALVRASENGPIVQLEARSGTDGARLWKTDMNDTRALMAAVDHGVAVATDFPRAFVTAYGTDGRPRYHVPLEGAPRALSAEGDRVAVALQGARGEAQVLVIEGGRVLQTHRFEQRVNALDLRAGHLAIGTSAGNLVVVAENGTARHNLSLDLDILSLRLSADAQAVVAGGYEHGPTAVSGGVAFFDFSRDPPAQWTQRTSIGVGLVDIDAAGDRALAVEESTPRHRLHAYDTRAVKETWGKSLAGLVSRDDAGHGGAAMSPDGASVVVGTLNGGLRAFDGGTGTLLWTYGTEGTTVVSFRQTYPSLFAANARLVPNGPVEGILLFSPSEEPFLATVTGLAAIAGVVIAVGGVVVLGVGYWRLRRSF